MVAQVTDRSTEATAAMPNLLIAGVPKAGTTTLYHWLGSHPDVYLSEPKEPHFFDVSYDNGSQWYQERYFPSYAGEPIIGDATPHLLYLPFVPTRLAKDVPDARVLVTLRNPIDRAYADWWMYWTRATEPLPFDQACQDALELARSDGHPFGGPDGPGTWRRYYEATIRGPIEMRPYIHLGHYAEQLERLLGYVDRDQLHVVLFEDLKGDPAEVREDLRVFLDLDDPIPQPEDRIHNAALGNLARPIYRAARATGAIRLFHLLPETVRARVKAWTRKEGGRPPMDTGLRSRLVEHFREPNQRLSDLLDRDLTHWNK